MLRASQLIRLNSLGVWMIAVNAQVGKRRYNNGLAAPQSNCTRNTTLVTQIQYRIDLHRIVHFDVRPLLANGLHQRGSRVSPHRQVIVQRFHQFIDVLFIVDH